MSGESLDEQRSMLLEDDDDDDDEDEPVVIQNATMARIVNDRSAEHLPLKDPEPPPSSSYQLPLRKPEFAGQRESVIKKYVDFAIPPTTATRAVSRVQSTPRISHGSVVHASAIVSQAIQVPLVQRHITEGTV